MTVTIINEIKILPPLAIARLGESPEPMGNYRMESGAIGGYRDLVPEPSLLVDPATGELHDVDAVDELRFKDAAGRVRPVAPFLELWGRFDDETGLRPVTVTDLDDLGVGLDGLAWEIRVANLKVFRRTGQGNDRIEARLGPNELADHRRHAVRGRAANFRIDADDMILGWAQFVRPDPRHPEIRFRFTPGRGYVYGHREDAVVPAERALYRSDRGWAVYEDRDRPTAAEPRARYTTAPSNIFARTRERVNLGYLDDTCDGIVSVRLEASGSLLAAAYARVTVGPPDYAPDSLHVRTIADELEQLHEGLDVDEVSVEEVLDIITRALETVRLMDTPAVNDNVAARGYGTPFDPDEADYVHAVERHNKVLKQLGGLHAAADSAERRQAFGVLKKIADVLRAHDQVWNLGEKNLKKMPALMRGGEAGLLALTRRQRRKILAALEQYRPASSGQTDPEAQLVRMIETLSWAATLHKDITTDGGATLDQLFGDPDQVMAHLKSATAQGADAARLDIQGDPLVVDGDPDASAFVKLVSDPLHQMSGPVIAHKDAASGLDGLQILRKWIVSLNEGVAGLSLDDFKAEPVAPLNISALFNFKCRGNPPSTLPSSAVGNCFPGLEFDFRNLWKHLFEGIELHEAGQFDDGHRVCGVDPGSDAEAQGLRPFARLIEVDGAPVEAPRTAADGSNQGQWAMEWSNALAHVVTRAGDLVHCLFVLDDDSERRLGVDLRVRDVFNGLALNEALAEPGALTQGLCSPWQADYRECGCFYWAASRPDYVNVSDADGPSRMHNWMQKERGPGDENLRDTVSGHDGSRHISYDDLYTDWQSHLRFIEKGNDKE